MKTKFLILAFLIVSAFSFSQNNQISNQTAPTDSHQVYKRIQINNVSEFKLQQLNNLGIDLTCGAVISNEKLTIELFDYELEKLDAENINYTVLVDDLQQFYSDRAVQDLPIARAKVASEKALSNQRSYSVSEIVNNVGQYDGCDETNWPVPSNWNLNPNSSPNSFGGCLTYAQVLQELDDMRALYPNLISARLDASPSNQTTIEGRTVYYVRISDNPDIDEAGEPETLYQSLIHSREAASVMQLLYYMWYILENYNTDTAIQNLVNNQALYFIPVFNPDGFVHNENVAPDGGGGQRKNRNLSAPGSCGTYTEGIDLNRNSAYYWGNGGSSTDPCNQTYMGTGQFSEPETQIMEDFFLQHDFKLALNHHSYKNAMLHAYAGTTITNPRPDEYAKYNHDMTYYNRYAHGPSTQISALNSGNMNDWMLGGPAGVSSNGTPTGTGSGKNTLAWTPENGLSSEGTGGTYGGFWPQPSNYLPIARRAMRMNFMAAYFSGKYAKLHDLNQTDITALSGSLDFAIENLGQTASDFTLTVTPVSSNIVSVGGPSIQTGMSVLQQNNVSISYSLDPSIQANDEVEFKVVLTNDYASDNVLYEANIKKVYNPTVVFVDNPDTDALSNWTQTGTWFTSTDAYSGSTAITSTNSAPYTNNSSKQLQMNGSLDLTNMTSAIIQFYGKWDLERSFDYVQIEGSTNGTSWTPLCGRMTKPGAPNANNTYSGKSSSDNNFQPDGEPLYDGDTQGKWQMEEIVIDATTNSFLFNQSTVYLRFDFRTDSSNRQDTYYNMDFEGFSFDDFKVIGITAPCNPTVPANVAASNVTSDSATITWDIVSGTTYDLRYKESTSSTWIDVLDLASNTANLTTLAPLTQYDVEVRSECSGGNASAYSASINFTTLDVQLNYCASTSSNVNDEYIGRVQLNTIDNPSGAQFYSDFTSISTTLTHNTQYTITITPTWTGTVYAEGYAVWIDYNRDGDFDDPGEQVFSQAATTSTPVSGNFTIPATAVENSTRMRVSMSYNAIPTACQSFTYGEVEDYTVIIQAPAPDFEAPTTPTNLISSNITSSTVDLNWTASTDNIGVTGYDVYQNGSVVGTTTLTSYQASGLLPSTNYDFYVIAKDAAGNESTASNTESITTLNLPNGCSGGITSYPYNEGFEGSLGLWTQNTGDDLDWTINSGGTPSSNTGPSSAVEGTDYIYVEASGNNTGYPNKQAVITSPCFDLTSFSDVTLTFSYHMFGAADMGSIDLEISADDGNTWQSIWNQTGNQGNSWLNVNLDLSSYSGGNILLRYNRITGSTWQADVAIDNFSLDGTGGPDIDPPSAVVLSASNTTQSSTDLSWTAATDNVGVTGYDVYQDTVFLTSVVGTTYQVTGLTASTSYDFYVISRDAAGNSSAASNVVNVTTLDPPDTESPTAPTNLSAQNTTETTTDLSWTASTDNIGVTGYDVYQNAVLITNVVGTTYQVIGLSPSTSYDFNVIARDAAGNSSASSNVVNVITPDNTAPSAVVLSASNTTQTSTDLSWTVSTDNVGVTGYDVYQDAVLITTVVGTTYQVTGLSESTSYDFYVIARDAAGNSSASSNVVNVTTLDPPDTIPPIITLIGPNTIDIDQGDTYTEQGATASDNVDGDISANIVIGGDVVDTNTVGTYIVTYNVSDTAGNAATEVTRTVNVNAIPDTTPPVITLNGSTPVNVEQGYSYTELGATATDDVDGDITANIIIGGDVVDTNTVGTYVVTYDVSDAAGNAATQVTRTVNVTPDATPPVVTLIGNSVVDITAGDPYNELGATATDNIDGDISANVIIGGDVVDNNTVGTYIVTYNVNDAAGNPATEVTRTVNVNPPPDTTPPVITLIGSGVIDLFEGDTYNEEGATASDNVDGDISANIVIGGDVVDTNTVGTYIVTYNVSDTAGNAATEVTRTVNVNAIPDTTPPVITLNGSTPVNVEQGYSYTELGATATDDVDGDITANIIIGGDVVDTNTVGTYVVTYDVSDAAGNAATQVTRTVNVTPDATAPILTLVGASVIDLIVGDTYTEQGATASDNIDGDITVNIVIAGDVVDTNTVGTYVVTYNVSDAAGNAANQIIRTVNVTQPASGCNGGISTFPYVEGFENTLGAWSQATNDDLDWTIFTNATPSNNTGPSGANEGSYYLYVEASGNNTGYPNKQAILNSACFDLSGLNGATFSFDYHMFGDADMGIFEVEISDDDGLTWNLIWSQTGNQGNSWQSAQVDISAYTNGGVLIRFNRVTGGTWKADIAIDNLQLTEGGVTITPCAGGISAPYAEGFESGIGLWTQNTNDDLNWTIDANGTPSNNTGPSSAIEGSNYLYVEASGNGTGYPNKQAIITSPCIDLDGSSLGKLDFNYHMFGSTDMGSLSVQVSNDNGNSWSTLWSQSGNQGDIWIAESIDLGIYAGQSVQLRFNRVTGGTWQADVAIDNINVTESPLAQSSDASTKRELKSLRIYPNPVDSKLKIRNKGYSEITAYQIFNKFHQLVQEGSMKSSIDVSHLKSGVYYLKLIGHDAALFRQFIKK